MPGGEGVADELREGAGGNGRTKRLLRHSVRPLGSLTSTSRRRPMPTTVPSCSQRRESGCWTATGEPRDGEEIGLLWLSYLAFAASVVTCARASHSSAARCHSGANDR